MRLDALLAGVAPQALGTAGAVEVTGVANDSRAVQAGDVFFALTGQHTTGAKHAAEAAARGARAIVATDALTIPGVPVVVTPEAPHLLGLAASRIAGDPTAAMCVVGVTGTNGKTTTTYLLEGIWRAVGRPVGVVGTIAYRWPGVSEPAPLTTPDAVVLQRLCARMRDAGTTHVVMEASSHALAQDRVAGVRFDAGVFTNLTRDHLDFHGSMDAYLAAKVRLFRQCLPASGKRDPVAIINVDDPTGAELATALPTRCVPVGRAPTALVRIVEVATKLDGTRGILAFADRRVRFTSRLVGLPHVENIACAAATAWALGDDPDAIVAGIAKAEAPAGRLERIAGRGFTVVVDYAHTPDALERVLATVRPLTPGALITVFGCGGDRDRGKRPLMGGVAAKASDVVIVTSDNPRTEDPAAIIADIEPGVRNAGAKPLARPEAGQRGYVVEPDRTTAIALAIRLARPGDVVIVAGKGHEDYQIIGTTKHHLDDREEVRRAIEARG